MTKGAMYIDYHGGKVLVKFKYRPNRRRDVHIIDVMNDKNESVYYDVQRADLSFFCDKITIQIMRGKA